MTLPTRLALAAFFLLLAARAPAADWEPTATADFAKAEKTGFGNVCGVVVDRASGDLYIDLSDKGLYHSTDQGKTCKKHGPVIKGRTEWPGCLTFDPTGKTRTVLLMATVYGGPVRVSEDA